MGQALIKSEVCTPLQGHCYARNFDVAMKKHPDVHQLAYNFFCIVACNLYVRGRSGKSAGRFCRLLQVILSSRHFLKE
uniref:28S ribosomal protein S9 n=1 Tax=Rhizophora mucronata TaxID=61149 RepID=A0A2P2J5T7_RHIMU